MRKTIFTFLAILFTVSIGYSQVTTLWEKSASTSSLPTWFGTDLTRGLGYGNNHVYVVSRTGGSFVYIFNAATGDSVGMLRTDGISGGTYAVSDVEVSSNGVIFVCNLTTSASTSAFKIYKYATEADSPLVAINYTAPVAARLGDKFTVTGSTADNSIIIWAASANTKELYKFTTADNGATFTATIIPLPSLATVASYGSASVGPLANGDFYYNAGGQNVQKYLADGTIIDTVSGGIVATGSNAIRFINTLSANEYFVTFAFGTGNQNGRIVKVPGGDLNLAKLVGTTNTLGANANTNGAGDVAVQQVSTYKYNIYVLSTNNGFGAYQLDLTPPRVQIIHNSADVLAGAVDIYVNGTLTLDNFAFRSATPYLDLPALETLNIGVAPSTSTSVNDTLVSFPVVLNYGNTYVVFANGVLDSSIYAQNPDARSTEFTLFVKPMARETAAASGVDLFVLHGATDAPAVDVQVRELGSATIIDNAAYGDITDYINAPAQNLTLDLYLADGTTYIATFSAPLAGLNGQSLAVFASGFLNPSTNQNGEGFGLFAALANGTVVQLPLGLAGDYYVGAPGTGPGGTDPQFPSLRSAFQTLNNSAFAGNCTFYITSDITETFTPAVGLGLAINPEPYIVTFKPYTGVQPVITLNYPSDLNSGPSGAMIIGIPMENNIAWNDLRKTTNIVFDGSNTVDGTTRDLTIQCDTLAQRNAFPLTIVGDVSNFVVKNTNIFYKAKGVSTSGNLFVSAVLVRSRSNSGVDFVPHNILLENNHISANFPGVVQSAQGYGTYQSGTPVPLLYPFNITLKNNLIEGRRRAVALYKAGSHVIVGNEIVLNQNVAANTTNEAVYAVDVLANSIVDIYNNRISKISSLTNTASNGNTGISIETLGTYNIYNNMIYGFELTAANPVAYLRGIKNSSASATLNLNFNSIYMNNLADIGTGTVTYQGILLSDGTNSLANNIVVSAEPDFVSYCIYRSGIVGTVTSDYNNFYPVSLTNGNVGFWDAAATPTLANWQTASGQDANSVSKEVFFVSTTDLHLTGSSNGDIELAGTPIAGITTDIDGDTRSTTDPYKGADEGSVSLEPKVPDLFISEYLEGSSNNKALELFNPTGSDIDLSKYRLVRANNGSATIQYTQTLTGTLVSGDVYVLANPSAVTEILTVADIVTGEITFFNGDDYIGLEKDVSGNWIVIDVVGILGNDPGTNWPVAGGIGATSEFTLVRKNTVFYGNTDWNASAGTDADNSEWLVYPQNTFTYLGVHSVIPVELTSFVANVGAKSVTLSWSTATETNNQGFEIERKSVNTEWTKIGFVSGFGTTTESRQYTYTDNNLPVGKYSYRLKQVDFDGTFDYSKVVEIEVVAPSVFELTQNYPNPFNPTTKISYSVPFDSKVTISVYSITGELVMELVNGNVSAGSYSVDFNGSNLASGMYIYRMVAGDFVHTQKMMLMK